jgi:hypothetical protein
VAASAALAAGEVVTAAMEVRAAAEAGMEVVAMVAATGAGAAVAVIQAAPHTLGRCK